LLLFGGVDGLTNPMLIIEVLSPSTEGYDRGDKFTHYKSIPSFTEYLLVAQHRPHISQFIRQEDNSWLQREFNDLSDIVKLSSLNCELPLSEVYQNVSFDPATSSASALFCTSLRQIWTGWRTFCKFAKP